MDAKSIWIVDPGMMEAGGHHAALAETLCQAKVRLSNPDITVYANKQLDKNLKRRFEEVSITIHDVFDCHFYKYFDNNSHMGVSGIPGYIRDLAIEYEIVLSQGIEKAKTKPVIVFLPCLNWEHANAFSLACNKHELELNNASIQIVGCVMYSPSTSTSENLLSNLWYKLSFKKLLSFNFFSLYGSEFELCKEYGQLFLSVPLKVHPCYLMDWEGLSLSTREQRSETENANQYLLLYFGDAKENKGFNKLPDLLDKALRETSANTKFIIQFTLSWEYPEITNTINKLKNWAVREPRIILHHGFWSNEELLNTLLIIKGAVCTYDTGVYQYKSSGLVWILAFLKKPFLIGGNCWLSREAERLELECFKDSELSVRCFDENKQRSRSKESAYKKHLFLPLIEWLVSH